MERTICMTRFSIREDFFNRGAWPVGKPKGTLSLLPPVLLLTWLFCGSAIAQAPGFPSVGQGRCAASDRDSRPQCGVEMTCSDRIYQLGNPAGVCVRADCAGIIAILHKRNDEASFRRRFFSYRHYGCEGRYVLKDQGIVQSGPVRLRELFLVLPGDLIEFTLEGQDCFAGIEVQNLGYLRKGNLCDLQKWLAEKTYMEMPNGSPEGSPPSGSQRSSGTFCRPETGMGAIMEPFAALLSLGKRVGVFPH